MVLLPTRFQKCVLSSPFFFYPPLKFYFCQFVSNPLSNLNSDVKFEFLGMENLKDNFPFNIFKLSDRRSFLQKTRRNYFCDNKERNYVLKLMNDEHCCKLLQKDIFREHFELKNKHNSSHCYGRFCQFFPELYPRTLPRWSLVLLE